jgi:hypothetical protein
MFLGVGYAIVIIRVLVVLVIEFSGRCISSVLNTVDLA